MYSEKRICPGKRAQSLRTRFRGIASPVGFEEELGNSGAARFSVQLRLYGGARSLMLTLLSEIPANSEKYRELDVFGAQLRRSITADSHFSDGVACGVCVHAKPFVRL